MTVSVYVSNLRFSELQSRFQSSPSEFEDFSLSLDLETFKTTVSVSRFHYWSRLSLAEANYNLFSESLYKIPILRKCVALFRKTFTIKEN